MLMAPCTLVLVVCTGIVLVVNGRGRAGEIVDLVDLDVERKGHVMPQQLKAGMAEQVCDVVAWCRCRNCRRTSRLPHGSSRSQRWRAQKAGAARNEYCFLSYDSRRYRLVKCAAWSKPLFILAPLSSYRTPVNRTQTAHCAVRLRLWPSLQCEICSNCGAAPLKPRDGEGDRRV